MQKSINHRFFTALFNREICDQVHEQLAISCELLKDCKQIHGKSNIRNKLLNVCNQGLLTIDRNVHQCWDVGKCAQNISVIVQY